VRERQPEPLDPWLARAAERPLVPLQRLAKGIRDDDDAVNAGGTLPWSNGPVEGHINRLKRLTRQLFGRARLDLLQPCFLLAASDRSDGGYRGAWLHHTGPKVSRTHHQKRPRAIIKAKWRDNQWLDRADRNTDMRDGSVERGASVAGMAAMGARAESPLVEAHDRPPLHRSRPEKKACSRAEVSERCGREPVGCDGTSSASPVGDRR
jgi:hypothetical protein